MKTQKISLTALQGKLSRNEMRHIMAGSGSYGSGGCAGYRSNGDGEILVFWGTQAQVETSEKWCCSSCATASWINSCNIC